ncbi:Serine/threonine-protein kinase N1 [Monoraphidium neglectum]|uniref:Serine/threonine-protein kinase N1 n=1 Tax=Monoraphidium neglectum TaxID=145388 RepID=A0A0D2MH04_9CHLO|nr:Serine/threonine-protein kinase N1 [Monoraphidium neglectum]KIY99971.1 Serine/threonine-protein kinase N1 [Monoraphidium neglectum]|eukprot:XP_013898991.1 Serine/threonine-protein kinase N1 [Monoraphidium neglectum]
MWSCFTARALPSDGPSAGLPDLAPFKAIRQIGRGAVGEVFLARHAGDGQLYAVKTVPLDAPSWRLELLKREERTYAALASDAGGHVGLLRPCRMQLLHDRLCLVTEWASGGTLASFLAAPRYSRGVAEDLALFIMRQLVAAVERLHENRVAYRDIKLDNILLDTTTFGAKAPRVLLADFGTCKAWEEGEAGCLASTFMGTPGFMAPQVLGSIFLHRESSASAAPSVTSALDDSARESSFPTPGSSAHSAPAAVGAGLASGSAGPMGVSSSNGMYDAVKADIYSLGAILMFLLFKELPFGFDKFSRLLPPGEALSVLWQLESEKSWREAAGAGLLRRSCDPGAIDLLDRMLQADESRRVDVAGIKAHPWFSRRLPRRYEAALARLARDQAGLDAARSELHGRASRRRIVAPAAHAHGPAAPPPARPLSGAEAALEQLFEAAGSQAALRRLREARASLYVDLEPAAVAAAWELGMQTEGTRPGAPPPGSASCGCAGGGVAAGVAEDTPESAAVVAPPSLAGRSDSATTTAGAEPAFLCDVALGAPKSAPRPSRLRPQA